MHNRRHNRCAGGSAELYPASCCQQASLGPMIRLAHFSDVHITAPQLGWTLRDWFNKRYAAWMNFRWLGRGRRFSRADEVLERFVEELHERLPDRAVFSGDATALGFE